MNWIQGQKIRLLKHRSKYHCSDVEKSGVKVEQFLDDISYSNNKLKLLLGEEPLILNLI